jgi:hypothetical protein
MSQIDTKQPHAFDPELVNEYIRSKGHVYRQPELKEAIEEANRIAQEIKETK